MWTSANSGMPTSASMPTSNVYTGTNRIASATYDAAGNQTVLGADSFAYDAENRLVSVAETPAAGGGQEQFYYDAMGQRVAKSVTNGPSRVYVYDAFGHLAAEYSTAAPSSTLPCSTCYLSTDHLGSTRLVTDESASIISRHDYVPFGEEIPASTAGRGPEWGPLGDNVNQKFTGQERDSETGLDYFHARFMSTVQGRFSSPDFSGLDQNPSNPQSWNLYSYVHNNPLNSTDPTGNDTCENGSEADVCVSGGKIDPVPIDPITLFPPYYPNQSSDSQTPPEPPSIPHEFEPPKNGNPPLTACGSAILNAVNDRFKTQFTDQNVTKQFQFSKGAPTGQGTFNLNFAVPAAMQPTKVSVGRYPVNPTTYVLGAGSTLHIPAGPGGADSPLTLPFGPNQFTAHLDSALPYNPIGFLYHLLMDMSNLGGYKPCP